MRTPSDSIFLLIRATGSRGGGLVHALAILVGLGLATVTLSLHLSHRRAHSNSEILAVHQAWSDRLARYGRIRRLVTDISVPAVEVFDSGDLPGESARSQLARLAFDAQIDSARLDLAHLQPSVGGALLADLEAVRNATDNMSVDVGRTFSSFSVGALPPDVAVINRHMALINGALDRLEHHARDAEGIASEQLLGSSAFLERMASAIPILASMLVVILFLRRKSSTTVTTQDRESVIAAPRPAEALDPPAADTTELARDEPALGGARAGGGAGVGLGLEPSTGGNDTLSVPGNHGSVTHTQPDVGEDSRTDEQLRRLTLVASKTASGVFITDAMGRAEWVNDAFVRITGHALDDVLGSTPDSFLRGPLTDPNALDRMVEGLRSGAEFRIELANETRDGRRYWVEVEATPICDPDGALCQFILIMTDVTERRSFEAALREVETRTRAIEESGTNGIVTFDDLGTIATVNLTFERIFGYRSGELIGMRVGRLIPALNGIARDRDDASLEIEPGSATASVRELVGRRRNGSAIPIELSVGRSSAAGCHPWTGVTRDLTQRKQAEALQAGQNRVIELLASEAPLVGSLTELIHLVERQQPGIVCMVLILHPGQSRLLVGASPSLSAELSRAVERVEIGPAACSWGAAAHSGKRVVVEDTATHPSWARFRRLALDHGLRASWAEPILSASGQVLGVFVAFHRRVHSPVASELEVVASAAQMAAIAIERARSIALLAGHDPEREASIAGHRVTHAVE